MEMKQAAPLGDIFVTVTGCKDVIGEADFRLMKDGAILCNAGHFNVEINMERLAQIADETEEKRKNITGYRLGDKWIYILAEGRLVNLAAGDGHPAEIMDMSFAIQALSAQYLTLHKEEIASMIIDVPEAIDQEVALRKLSSMKVTIDVLTEAQEAYLEGWKV